MSTYRHASSQIATQQHIPSVHVERGVVTLFKAGALSRIRWINEPAPGSRLYPMWVPSRDPEKGPYRVIYNAVTGRATCTCAGGNHPTCSHRELAKVFLGLRSLPSYLDGWYRVIGVQEDAA